MKKLVPFFGILLLVLPGRTTGHIQQGELDWLQKWFSAWELVSKDVLMLPAGSAPEMLFFDKDNVYSTSRISIPKGRIIKGPAFFGQQLNWRMAPHKGMLTIPDGQQAPVGLMSFAAPAKDGKGKNFFVMAAPAFWKEAGIGSDELGLDKLLIGVFLHEFAHTRQMNGIGAMVEEIEKNNKFEKEMNDDIVQDHFKKDSAYVQLFNAEVNKFYEASFAADTGTARMLMMDAINLYKKRQLVYFKDDKAILKRLDDIFLSMEGLGQYIAVAWLIHPRGGNISYTVAVNGFRRKRNQWSQEEGLALFLLFKRLAIPDWKNDMFGEKPRFIIDLLEEAGLKK